MTRVVPDVSGKCPFCGGSISFGANPAPFAMHSFPYCKKFLDLDVVEFLHAVNVEYVKRESKSCVS
jgi:hypothetical protein